MSSVQAHRIPSSTTTATVAILDAIGVAVLLQLNMIPLILAVPIFLIPVSIYAAVIGIYKKRHAFPHDYGYHLKWSAIMLSVGVTWLVLYEKLGVIIGIISVLSIILAFVYVNKAAPLRAK